MNKKKTRGLGNDPLAIIIPDPAPPAPTTPAKRKRERFTSYVSAEAADTLRNIAWWSRVPLASLVESAFRREIEAREKENGGAFDKRRAELNRGALR